MKKTAIFTAFLVLILVFAGCKTATSLKQGSSHSEAEGVSVEVCGINTGKKTTLEVLWTNDTKYDVTYGAEYSIERMEDGEWVDCSVTLIAFALPAYTIKENETLKKEYMLTDMYDISRRGLYRFVSHCTVEDGSGENSLVWAEFEID